ncbi:Hypothetical protein PHPALM_3564 [Phytophthora palmivora]|uniref:ZSWIM1/3 RNaseH-like domain-containing protein n=1 Tax=Phytophthora palmivora TaxID=4796 RepID=A0A2P4YM30_9STRA|nr:Hypothetical protein PHPALM_3564 [Phytophthora palmivora]
MATTKPKKRKYSSENDDRDHQEPVQSFDTFDGVCSSWEAFQSAFDKYNEDTHQLYKIRSTISVKDRNRSRAAQAAKRGTTAELWGEELGSYAKYFICTHGWEFKPRGKGTRTNHRIRSTGSECKSIQDQDDNTFKVRVTVHNAGHNHDVNGNVYYSYPEARKINSPGTQSVVKTLIQGGSKKMKILRYLKEVSGKPILPKDVENLIAKMRRETYTSENDNVRVSQLLRDFSEGPGNAVNVFRDSTTGLTSCITFQSAFMRRMTRKFPEALCVDATYGTNINR